ncbi:hypothetical protein PG994_013206 [Apiospora phragmitis]|uniref:Uncharacterized protein n=1 Tax=Apiospora phragmitis TaxID=2905665 RepID=A0ABR1TAI9_9PEZI
MWMGRKRTTTALPAFANEKPASRRQIPLWVLLVCAVCFFVSALILGLGLRTGLHSALPHSSSLILHPDVAVAF